MSKKWYIVNTHSGFEGQAKKALEEQIKRNGLEGQFGEILVPSENVVQLVKGKKQTRFITTFFTRKPA